MSIQAQILNSILRKFVKAERQNQKEYSYTDARKLMNQPGYEDQNANFVSKFLAKKIFGKKQSNINIEEIYLDNIRTLKFSSSSFTTNKCILYFHGGGYIAGSPETHQNFLTHLCNISEIPIYAIDYSLAPEKPFPAALNDAVSSYQSILKIGYNPENIFIGGDSAGGNLTLICTLQLQKINQKLPSKLFLLSPWTDLTASGESIKFNAESSKKEIKHLKNLDTFGDLPFDSLFIGVENFKQLSMISSILPYYDVDPKKNSVFRKFGLEQRFNY